MKNLVKKGIILIALLCFGKIGVSQFVLSGEIRPRSEYLHGYKTLLSKSQDPAFWTEQRSRLRVDYSSSNYSVGMVLQDIRVWGNTSQLNKTDAFSSVHEAWGAFPLNPKLSVKLGRQEVIYDDHRIFGNVGWAQQARSHDMAKMRYQDSGLTVDLGLAYNQNTTRLMGTTYTGLNNYKTFQYIWVHKDFSERFKLSLLALNNGLQYLDPDTVGPPNYSVKFSQTLGTHLVYKKGKLSVVGSAYYQMGKDGANKDLNAYNFKLEGMVKVLKKLSTGLGYEELSGTSQVNPSSSENNSFNPFFGTNHKFNGFMDYFYVGNHANNVGLRDAYFKLKYLRSKKLNVGLAIHAFLSAADIRNRVSNQAMDAFLGNELDLTIKYKHSKQVAFQWGYSHMLATSSMEALKGGDKNATNNWAYMMISFKPVFFKKEIRD